MGVLNVERTQSNSVRCHVYLSTDVQERSWSLLKSGFSQEPNNRRRIISLWTLIETLIKTNKQKKKLQRLCHSEVTLWKRGSLEPWTPKPSLALVMHIAVVNLIPLLLVHHPPASAAPASWPPSIFPPSFSSLIPHSATWGQFQTFTSFFFLLFPRLLLLAFTKRWWKGKDGPSVLWFVHWA